MGEGEFEMLIAEMDRRIETVIPDDLGKKIQKAAAAPDDLPVVLYRETGIEVGVAPEPVGDEIIVELVFREYLAIGRE